MATRFRTQFVTKYDEEYRVDIDDADYSGSVIELDTREGGFTLSYDGKTDTTNPGIMGSRASVSILVTPDNRTEIDDFAADVLDTASAENRFTVAIYKITAGPTVSLYWVGYLLPDLGEDKDTGESFFTTIKAVDGLARLKDIDYDDSGAPYGNITFLSHLYNALTEVGNKAYWGASDVWLRTVVNWYESGMPTPAANIDPLAYSRVQGEVFAKKKNTTANAAWDFLSCYKVLEHLCRHWNARLIQSNGSWRFEQVRERREENFYERRYDDAGALLSSTALAGYDRTIFQTAEQHRFSGGSFSSLPALKTVRVNYDHDTYINQLSGQEWRWQKNSSYSSQTYLVGNVSFDSDSFFRVSGKIHFDVETTYVDLNDRWHLVFGVLLRLPDNPYRLRSLITLKAPVGSPSSPAWTFIRETPSWTSTDSGIFYEVSSLESYNIFTSGKVKGAISFSFQTPYIPSGQKSFSINLSSRVRGEYVDGSPATLTFTDWKVSDLVMTIAGVDNADNFEVSKTYPTDNAQTGNSEFLEIDTIFGHAVKGWTPCKIQVTEDLITWTDSTATWDRGADTNDDEFGELLSRQSMLLQQTPVQVYTGSIHAKAIHAHSRIVFPDSSTWLINRGDFLASENIWQVEMMKTGIADVTGIIVKTPIRFPEGRRIPPPDIYKMVSAPSDGTGTATSDVHWDRVILSQMTANVVTTALSTGSITSIPVEFGVRGGVYNDGDVITVMHPQNGNLYTFVVDGDIADGATSITVESTAIPEDLPIGSIVFYPIHNIVTNDTGNGGQFAPPGTAQGEILRWNDTDGVWEPYGSGVTDGYVLTWDTTNGWQAEAASGGGDILDGGNTTGATVVIGTNDANALAFETNNVTRVSITGGASTGGAVSITDVSSNTSTAEYILTLTSNSTGTALAGFGSGILFQAESSTTDSQVLGRLFFAWLTATHASRASKMAVVGVYNGSEVEIGSFDATNSGNGRLLIGASSPVVIENNAITTATTFTVGGSSSTLILGNSSGPVSIVTTSASAVAIQINPQSTTATSSGGISILNGYNLAQTSGTRSILAFKYGFAPTSGTAVHNQILFDGTFNQTGGANGITRGIFLNQTLTAVADFRALEIAADHANAKGIYQTGTSIRNNFAGPTAFGTTSAPDTSAIVDIVSTTKGLGFPSMTTTERDAIGSPRDGLVIYNSTTDTVDVRANGAWVSLGTGSGTITGSGSSGQIAYWSGASSITGEAALNYDAANNRLGITETSPDHSLHIRQASATDGILLETDGTADQSVFGIQFAGTAAGPYVQRGTIGLEVYSNAGAIPDGHSISFKVSRDGASTYQPLKLYYNQASFTYNGNFTLQNLGTGARLRIESTGSIFSTTNWLLANASYTTADANARLKLVGIGTTSSNYGLKIHDGGNTAYLYARDDKRIGIGVDPADAKVQIKADGTGTNKALLVEDSGGTDHFYIQDNGVTISRALGMTSNAPTIAFGAAAGTGPTEDLTVGGNNGFNITFTTGTSPTASSSIFTATFTKSYPNGCVATFAPGNDNAVGVWMNCKISGTANNSITFAYVGTLAASTTYSFLFTVMGY